ncbi:MAG: hypothetical protein EAZ91_26100 [Cytophagales bacterium]|nr:MAG: hypothetical protein EAZ91_26100 [Cytophagales bacterium]
MTEITMLLDLKRAMEANLELFEEQILLSDPLGDDEEFNFLLKKAANFRDTLQKIEQRISEIQGE